MLKVIAVILLLLLCTISYAETPSATVYDFAIDKVRNGGVIPVEEVVNCSKAFIQYYDDLSVKNDTRNNNEFSENDRVEFYINAVKMAIIDPTNHHAWPFRSELRFTVLNGLKKEIEQCNDSFALFCSIFPALDNGEQEYAVEAFKKLVERDEFLAKLTLQWLINDYNRPKIKEQFLKAIEIEAGKSTP